MFFFPFRNKSSMVVIKETRSIYRGAESSRIQTVPEELPSYALWLNFKFSSWKKVKFCGKRADFMSKCAICHASVRRVAIKNIFLENSLTT